MTSAAYNLTENKTVSPLAERAGQHICIREPDVCPWVWCEDRSVDDPLGRIFQGQFDRYHRALQLRTPDKNCQQMLRAGAALLRDLFPKLSQSVFDHVHVVAIVALDSVSSTSFTDPRIPGTIFLSPSTLTNPWDAAEYLLHEALHIKFVDLEHTHSLVTSDFALGKSPKIRALWNRPLPGNENEWLISRALTVMHVYTSLAFFFTAVQHDSPHLGQTYGALANGFNAVRQKRRALDRARYLGEQLEHHSTYLGFAGRRFVRWLKSMLDALDPYPPPPDSRAHLLLDLYEREAVEFRQQIQRLGTKIGDTAGPSLWALQIAEITKNEIDGTHDIVYSLKETPGFSGIAKQWNALATSKERDKSLDEAAQKFLSVRACISEMLRSVPPESYLKRRGAKNGTGTAGELVQEMVEHSGQSLNGLFESWSS